MAILQETINTTTNNTSAPQDGGIVVSTGPDPVLQEQIRKARQEVYDSLQTGNFTFEQFNQELDDPEFGDEIIRELAENSRLKGWTYETLSAAVREGKSNGVSSQGSEPTSEVSQGPLASSQGYNEEVNVPFIDEDQLSDQQVQAERQALLDPERIPAVRTAGTWREGFEGTFSYDLEGFETYTPTQEVVKNLGGWDNVAAYFQREHPNVLVFEPTDEFVTGTGNIVNYDSARPVDLNALRKQDELDATPFDQWSQDDKTDYFLANVVTNNIAQGNSVTAQEIERRTVEARAAQDAVSQGPIMDAVSSAGRGFGSGATRLAADALGIVPWLNDVVANIINTKSFKDTYGDTFIQEAQDYLRGAIRRDDLYNQIRFGEKDISDTFSSGDVNGGINKVVSGITNSLPIMLSLSAGNASGLVTTLSMGAGQYDNLQANNQDMDRTTKLMNSVLNMYAEVIPERIGANAVFKPFYRLFQKSGREVAEAALAKTLRQVSGQLGVLTPTAVEASTEYATLVMQNAIAKYSGEDPDRPLNQGAADAIILGGASGGVISSPAYVANSIVNSQNRSAAETLMSENRDIEITLNNKELDPQLKQSLTEKYLRNTATINEYIENEVDRKGSLSTDQRSIVNRLEAQKERVSRLIDNPEIPDSVQEGAQQDIENINEQINEILEQAPEATTTTTEPTQTETVASETTETPVEGTEVVPVGEQNTQPETLVESVEETQEAPQISKENTPYRVDASINGLDIVDGDASLPEIDSRGSANIRAFNSDFEIVNHPYGIQTNPQSAGYYTTNKKGKDYLVAVLPVLDGANRAGTIEVVIEKRPDMGQRDLDQILAINMKVGQKATPELANQFADQVFKAINYRPEALVETENETSQLDQAEQTLREADSITPPQLQRSMGVNREVAEGLINELEANGVITPFEPGVGRQFTTEAQVATPEITEDVDITDGQVVGEISTPGFFETLTNTESRTSRLSELESRLRDSINNQNLGITPNPRQKAREDLKFLRDLTEYAVLKIADGTVKTANAFKDLAKGLGEFGDEVLNRAYYNARNVSQSYLDTNPDRANMDEATGNILQRMQDVTVGREPATTKVTPKVVREVTDGGTKGLVQKINSIKQANREFYKTLERGAKIGTRGTKQAIREVQKQVREAVRETFRNSPIPLNQAISSRDFSKLITKVSLSNNQTSLDNTLAVLEEISKKAEVAGIFSGLSQMSDRSKKRSRSERLPSNIKQIFGEFSRIPVVDMYNRGLLSPGNRALAESVLFRMNDLYENTKPNKQHRGNMVELQELKNDIKFLSDKVERLKFEAEKDSLIDHLKELTKAAGGKWDANTDVPKNYRDYRLAVDALETTIQEQNLDEPKSRSATRENNELFIEQNLSLLDDLDLSEFTTNEQKAIQDMKQITPELLQELSDADVFKLAVGLPNLINNGRLDGIGSAIAKVNSYRLAADQSFTAPVKKAALSVPALGKLVASFPGMNASSYNRFIKTVASTSQRVDALFKDMQTKGKFLGQFGIQAYKEGRNVAQRLYENAQKEFGEMVASDKDVRDFLNAPDRGVREIKLGIYAWLNQQELGLDVESREALFFRKIETLKKMLDMLDPATLKNRVLNDRLRDNKAYYDNLRKGIQDMMTSRSIVNASSKLGPGESKVYAKTLDMFDSLRPEFLANARLFNNVDLDTNIDNYTPINYEFFAEVSDEVLLTTSYNRAFASAKISGRSGSGSAKDRVIKDGSLPRNAMLDFNFINNVFKNYGLQLADIHTQGPRMQIHHNLANTKLRENTDGINLFKSIGDLMTEEMMGNYSYFSSPRAMNIASKLRRALLTSAYGKALGGVGQFVKQFVPMITDAMVRTGDVSTFFTYWQNSGKISKFIADQDISRRGVQSSQMGASVANDLNIGEAKNSAFNTVDKALDLHEKIINNWVLGPLRLGDVHGARMSWMMYYNQYAKDNNIVVDYDSVPNADAAAYADNMVDVTGNTSVDSAKAKLTQSMWAKMFFPFSGAALTSVVNMGVNTSKLITAIQTKDSPATKQALNAMIANSAAITIFQMVGFGMRAAAVTGLASLGEMALSSIDLEDDDEEEKVREEAKKILDDYVAKRAKRNVENSLWYWTNDIVHRGLLSQGPLEPVSNGLLKALFTNSTGITVSNYRSTDPNQELFNALGIYGIVPAGIYSTMSKESSLFNSAEEDAKAAGYGAFLKADGTYGYKDLDGKSMPQSVRVFQKAMNVLEIPAMVGIQDQMLSTIMRTTPQLYKELEKVVYKDVPKVPKVSQDKKFDNKFTTLNYKGRNLKLDKSEAKLFRDAYDAAYKEFYKPYVEANKPLFGEGPKLEEYAAKHIYKKAKEKLFENKEFKELWDLKSVKNK